MDTKQQTIDRLTKRVKELRQQNAELKNNCIILLGYMRDLSSFLSFQSNLVNSQIKKTDSMLDLQTQWLRERQ